MKSTKWNKCMNMKKQKRVRDIENKLVVINGGEVGKGKTGVGN